MHYKVTLKRVQAARINTNISKQLNEHCTNPANKLLCKSVAGNVSRLVQYSADIRERAGFYSICDNAQIHLLLSGLTIGWNDSSFPFGVHGGLCLKTFNLLNTCQRKRPGKRSISIATRLVFSSLFVHLQHWPQIRHSFYWGNLKQSTGGFFFFQSLFQDNAHPPLLWRKGGAS